MNARLLVLSLALTAGAAPAADDLKSILDRPLSPKTAQPLVESYIRDHPKADDLRMAQLMLGQIYAATGENSKGANLLEQWYPGLPKGADGDISAAVTATASLVTCYVALGDKAKAGNAIARLQSDFKDNPQIGAALQAIEEMKGELNKPAKGGTMSVSFKDIDGHQVDLASLAGKVVLVDFWATWCPPCRQELPHVIKAYETWHSKGFEVIGISLDKDEATLRAFVKENKMEWPQYFDGKGWENTFTTKFGITSIPATFLIGKDGKVAATGLHGDALEKQLTKLLRQD